MSWIVEVAVRSRLVIEFSFSRAASGSRCLTGPRVPDVGIPVIKLFSARFYFYLPGEGGEGRMEGDGEEGRGGGQERVMKSFQQGTFCSSFFFHSNYVMSRLLSSNVMFITFSHVSFYSLGTCTH